VGCLLALALAVQDPAALVEKLRSEKIEDRDAAARRLLEMGRSAFPALQRATRDKDPEVGQRVRHLLRVLALRDRLSPSLRQALPGLEERLAAGPDSTWTEAFLEASSGPVREGNWIMARVGAPRSPFFPESDGGWMVSGRPRHAALRPEDLEPLAGPALRGAEGLEQTVEVLTQIVLRQLRGAIPDIVALLRHEDAALRREAVETLLHLGARKTLFHREAQSVGWTFGRVGTAGHALALAPRLREAFPGLVRMLREPDPEMRKLAALALARFDAREHAGDLLPLLTDSDLEVRTLAAFALGELSCEAAIPALADCLGDKEDDLKAAAVEALGHIGRTIPVSRAITDKIALLIHHPQPYVGDAALDALIGLGPQPYLGQITDLIGKPAADFLSRATAAMSRLTEKNDVAGVLVLAGSDRTREEVLIDRLVELKAVEAAPDLVAALRHENPAVRRTAVRALARLGLKAHADSIVPLLADADDSARDSAAEALHALEAKDQVPAIAGFLSHSDPRARAAAVYALGLLESRSHLPRFLELLQAYEREVRDAAAEALGRLGSRDHIPPLRSLLDDDRPGTRAAAIRTLGRLHAEASAPGIAARLKDGDFSVREAAAEALGRLGARDRAAEVAALLDDTADRVRAAAATALGVLGDSRCAADLARLMEAKPKSYVGAAAANSLALLDARDHREAVARFARRSSRSTENYDPARREWRYEPDMPAVAAALRRWFPGDDEDE
jgi:HEAT repeat protein